MPKKKYWSALFTGITWEEFINHGAKVMGFKETKKKSVQKISLGDYIICYVSGISRFISIIEVISEPFVDKSRIWELDIFPIGINVKIIYVLEPKTAVSVIDLKNNLSIFQNLKSPNRWSGFFLSAPREINEEDGEIIVNAIKNAVTNPVEKDYKEKSFRRKVF